LNKFLMKYRFRLANVPKYLIMITLLVLLGGCDNIGFARPVPPENQSSIFKAPTFVPTFVKTDATGPILTETTPQSTDCENQLQWLYDLSIPDGTQVAPGFQLDKQWQVKNNGSCNWGEGYSLRLTAGPEMGATSPQSLIPARSGSEAVIRIQFTAPGEPGRYRSAWQAFSPDGKAFGDDIYIEIVVTTP
jgi:hypothetical protein